MKPFRTRSLLGLLALAVWPSLALGQTTTMFTFTGDSAGDGCGVSVASAGDVDGDGKNDVVAGHYGYPGATYAGRVRVYSGMTGAILFTLDGAAAGDQFGFSVDGAGDVNADGYADIIVGAPGADSAGLDAGKAQVFLGPTGALLYTFNGNSAFDHLGCSVAGAGDVNGDGRSDVIVGAYGDDATGLDAGSAWVYSGMTGAQLFVFHGTLSGDWFGFAVHSAGDFNNDGTPDFVIGAPASDLGGPFGGIMAVISGLNGSTLFTAIGNGGLGGGPGDLLGWAVAGVGDVNNDGFDDVIGGGPGDSSAAFAAGAATVYGGPAGTFLLYVSGLAQTENHGYSVAKAGDVNGDGRDDFIVGSFTEPTSTSPGVVRVYSGLNAATLYTLNGGSAPGDSFGQSVAGLGDLNNDGRREIAVGAPLANSNGTDAGSVRVLTLLQLAQASLLGPGCGGTTNQPTLNTSLPKLGTSVSMSIIFGPPSSAGAVVMSLPPAGPIPLGSGCTVFVDPAAFTQVASPVTGPGGSWSTFIPIPNNPAWAGIQLAVQGVFPGTSAPLGFHLTSARLITLGY